MSPAPATSGICARCRRPHAEDDVACALCGALLRETGPDVAPELSTVLPTNAAPEPPPSALAARLRAAIPEAAPRRGLFGGGAPSSTAVGSTRASAPAASAALLADEPRIAGIPEPLFYLGLGLVTAPLFGVTPLVRLIGWFLGALVHEMGHSLMGWAFGLPSFPAISLTAEAAAIHGERVLPLVLVFWAAACWGAWRIPHRALRFAVLPLAAVLYPALAFTGAHEVAFLVGGHLGELAFAVLCLHRALSGGFTESSAERGLYGTVGWYLVGSNVLLAGGLAFSASRRALYASNGSFGIKNDYLRLAEDVLGLPVEAVALGMGLVALAAPAVALATWWAGRRAG